MNGEKNYQEARRLYPKRSVTNSHFLECDCPNLGVIYDDILQDPEDEDVINSISENIERIVEKFPELIDESINFFVALKRSASGFEGKFYVNFESEKIANIFCGLTPEGNVKKEKRLLQNSTPHPTSQKRSWADEVEDELPSVQKEVDVVVKTFSPHFELCEGNVRELHFTRAEVDVNRLLEDKKGGKIFLENPDVLVSSVLPPGFSDETLKNYVNGLIKESVFMGVDMEGCTTINIVPLDWYDPNPYKKERDSGDYKKATVTFTSGSNLACFIVLLLRRAFCEIHGKTFSDVYFSRGRTLIKSEEKKKPLRKNDHSRRGEAPLRQREIEGWEVARKKK